MAEAGSGQGRLRHLRFRTLLLLLVLLPTLGFVVTVSSTASSKWSYRNDAARVQRQVARVGAITSARVNFESWVLPSQALTYAAGIGISASVLDSFLRLHFRRMLRSATADVESQPLLRSTPALASQMSRIASLEPLILSGRATNAAVNSVYLAVSGDLYSLWQAAFAGLQRDVSAWQPPGSFEEHVQTLRRTFQAYLDALAELQYGNMVLNGRADASTKAALVSAVAGFDAETAGIASSLGPRALAVWRHIQADSGLRSFVESIATAERLATVGGSAPFAADLSAYAADFRNGLRYLAALDQLMVAASKDLTSVTSHQQAAASDDFASEIAFLVVLAAVALGGALLLGRALSRPVRRLGHAAERLQTGDFSLPPLPAQGPSEVVAAAGAFNDMVAMLRSIEAKVLALASEDLGDPVLQEPLPGRLGRALQRSVDHLTARVRERESQRQQLEEQATHDSLTGLLNRAAVMDVLSHDLRRRRGEGDVIAVLFVDLDGLKTINDTFGHDAGDQAIRATADALRAATRSGDAVARLGGDEFLVMLHVREPAEAEQVAARVCRAVEAASFVWGGEHVALSCSVGIAVSTQGSESDPAEVIRAADRAMYDVKRARARSAYAVSGSDPQATPAG
jgi:diguanylate cyclase (GGDEF)-like protein